jgi:hypothetical protein
MLGDLGEPLADVVDEPVELAWTAVASGWS